MTTSNTLMSNHRKGKMALEKPSTTTRERAMHSNELQTKTRNGKDAQGASEVVSLALVPYWAQQTRSSRT